jgi:hypothetical protein
MSTMIRVVALAAGLGLAPAAPGADSAPSGPVSVEFVNPAEFTDIKTGMLRTNVDNNAHLNGLRRYLERAAASYLQPGQSLRIVVTDIDLAGDITPHSNPALLDIRTVSSVYPPRIDLNYTLTDASGAVVRTGEARLRDLGFDIGSGGGRVSDPLRYEKRMLDKWLRSELGGSR